MRRATCCARRTSPCCPDLRSSDPARALGAAPPHHLAGRVELAADGFASLAREDAGMNVVFLRRGLPLLPEDQRDTHAAGLILAFPVEDLEGDLARLREEGMDITMPLREEPWGERAFQVTDPNGVIVQLLDWNAPAGR